MYKETLRLYGFTRYNYCIKICDYLDIVGVLYYIQLINKFKSFVVENSLKLIHLMTSIDD